MAPTYHVEIILLLQCVVFAVLSIVVFEKEYTGIEALAGPGKTPVSTEV